MRTRTFGARRTFFARTATGAAAAFALWTVAALAGPIPGIGTIGSEVTIHGVGFGPKPKASLVLGTEKPIKLKVRSATDTAIVTNVVKARVGIFDVVVKSKGLPDVVFPTSFEIRPPVVAATTPTRPIPGEEVTLRGVLFGTKKPKVKIGGKTAKVLTFTPIDVKVKVHKRIPLGAQIATLQNAVGTASLAVMVGEEPICTGVQFAYTGASQTWTVPDGVFQATFDLAGAPGGGVGAGRGGYVRATIPVTPGEVLTITVGGQGLTTGEGGFNGGGDGGGGDAGGGGGATDLRRGGVKILIASGGGGVGGGLGLSQTHIQGGDGGGLTGGPGGGTGITGGGSGGEQASGGFPGGCSNPTRCVLGEMGSLGQGGNGALTPAGSTNGAGGGGGGGGYYGGGSGGVDKPEEHEQIQEQFHYTFGGGGGGGGGSSFGPPDSLFQNNTPGDGYAGVSFICPTKR